MPKYRYKATTAAGRVTQGVIDATNVDDLELRLERMDLILISHKAARDNRDNPLARLRQKTIPRQEMITFAYHMEQMMRGGVSLLEGLNDIRDSITTPRFREVLTAVIEDVESGKSLSAAMGSYPEVFGPVFPNLVQVGEQTGKLPDIFADVTEDLKWEDEMAARTKKIMMYPIFVGTVMVGVVFFMMLYLVPKLMVFIQNMGQELPFHTKALIATSEFLQQWWYLVLGVPFVVVMGVGHLARLSPEVRMHLDRLKLGLWLFGPLSKKLILARFAKSFAMMYGAGVTVLETMRIAQGLANNMVIRRAIADAQDKVSQGENLGDSMQQTGLFPPLVIRMVRVGENTGELDKALNNVAYFFNREVKESIDKLQSLIEPFMTVFMGFIIGWIMLSVMGPIYDTITKIQM
ncbi:MAG: type II secretion system F family protein [Magnetococcus sp. WYHC-3]